MVLSLGFGEGQGPVWIWAHHFLYGLGSVATSVNLSSLFEK